MRTDLSTLKRLVYPPKQRTILTTRQVRELRNGTEACFDVELYPNFFRVGFKHVETQTYFAFEESPDCSLDIDGLREVMWQFCLVGFNSINYDIHIIDAALKGWGLEALQELSDAIILQGEIRKRFGMSFNHYDLIEVAPLQGSLKLYAARLHTERLQELPIPAHTHLTAEQAEQVREYNFNDLDCTDLLREGLKEQIQQRIQIGASINEDLRSKSDAQMAETIIGKRWEALHGHWPRKTKPEEIDFTPRRYNPPDYIFFETPLLQNAFKTICDAHYPLDANGYVQLPPEIDALKLRIDNQLYQMSIGGLHSTETCVGYNTLNNWRLSDFDVASFYPKIILNGGIYPPNMGEDFLLIYKGIVVERIDAKKAGDVIKANGLKITTNGTFGKTGNPWSIMFAPELMIYITLTGQLTLLMKVELLTQHGFHVVSANTDGIVVHYHASREAELMSLVKEWERRTSFEMEQTRYNAYYARDVNNYFAVKQDGKCKTKGAYCERGSALDSPLSKSPDMHICSLAVQLLLTESTPIEKTINECQDIRQFVCVRNVKSPGAHKDGTFLGKVVRWYYAEREYGTINYVQSGNKVAKTDGAKPLMEMDGSIPHDLDRGYYIRETEQILYDIGYHQRAKQKLLI